MTALATDKKIEYTEGVEVPVPVDGGSKIFAGANACFNAAGFLVPGADTAGLIYAGVSRSSIDNSLGQDGDESAIVRRRGLFLMELATAITQANVGDNVFLVDDQLVDLAGNVTNIFCGIICQYATRLLPLSTSFRPFCRRTWLRISPTHPEPMRLLRFPQPTPETTLRPPRPRWSCSSRSSPRVPSS